MNTSNRSFGRLHNLRRSEEGFGIIEVIVSFFLLAVSTMSFIPVLVSSWTDTGKNTTIATATQIVNEQIEGARAVRSPGFTSPSCHDVTQFLEVTLAPVTDPRKVTLRPQWDATTCPSTYPGVVRARVSVTRSGDATPIASAVTLIFVLSAA